MAEGKTVKWVIINGECVEETRVDFDPNLVHRRVVPCPELETRADGMTNEPSVHVSNSLKEVGSGKNLKKKRKGKRIPGRTRD